MRFLTAVGSLSQIFGGILTSGTVPWGRASRTRVTGTNAGLVTTGSGAYTAIATADCGPVTAGDLVVVTASVQYNAGAGAPGWGYRIDKSAGTATIVFDASFTTAETAGGANVGLTERGNIAAIASVTGSGTLTLRLSGASTNSRDIAIGNGQLACIVLAGS